MIDKDLDFLDTEEAIELVGKIDNESFKSILISDVTFLKERNTLNIEKIEDEIFNMKKHSINLADYVPEGDEIENYHRLINDIDQQRTRVVELTMMAQNDYNGIHSIYNQLISIWKGSFSGLGSDKKREGEADMIMHFLMNPKLRRKEIWEILKSKLSNLGNKMDAVSRKITIAQESRKMFPGHGKEYSSENKYRLSEKPEETEKKEKEKKDEEDWYLPKKQNQGQDLSSKLKEVKFD